MKKLEEIVDTKVDLENLPEGWRRLAPEELGASSKCEMACCTGGTCNWILKKKGAPIWSSTVYIAPVDPKDYPQRSVGDKRSDTQRSDPMPTGTWCIILPDQLEAFLKHNPGERTHHSVVALQAGQLKAIYAHHADSCICIIPVRVKQEVNYLMGPKCTTYEIPGVAKCKQIHLQCNDCSSVENALDYVLNPEKPYVWPAVAEDQPKLLLGQDQYIIVTREQEADARQLLDPSIYKLVGTKNVDHLENLKCNDFIVLANSGWMPGVRKHSQGETSGENWYKAQGLERVYWAPNEEAFEKAAQGLKQQSPVVNKIEIPKGHYIVVTKENFEAAVAMFDLAKITSKDEGTLGSEWFKSMQRQGFAVLRNGGWMPAHKVSDDKELLGEDWYRSQGNTRHYWHESEVRPYTHTNATVKVGPTALPKVNTTVSVDPNIIKNDKVDACAAAVTILQDPLSHAIFSNGCQWSSAGLVDEWIDKLQKKMQQLQKKMQQQVNHQFFSPGSFYAGSYNPAAITPVYLSTPKENEMFTREQEEAILNFMAKQNAKTTPKGPGLVRKTAGLGFSVLNWALISPAKSLVRPGLKLIQYGIFAAATIASGYAGWQLSKKIDLPSIQSPIKWEASSPSDNTVAK